MKYWQEYFPPVYAMPIFLPVRVHRILGRSKRLIYRWLLAIGECRVGKTRSLLPIPNVNHTPVEP
jgi:hypothetical protein